MHNCPPQNTVSPEPVEGRLSASAQTLKRPSTSSGLRFFEELYL
jgi:hypothetical protein